MNKLRNQNYLALDLEMNKNSQGEARIIQVGVAVGNPYQPNEIRTWSWYLDPQEPIDPYITELTGISDEIIRSQAISFEKMAEELGQVIKDNDVYINPIQWGVGDADKLKEELLQRGIEFPFFGRRYFDVKTIFVFLEMANGRALAGGLSSSMGKYKIPFQGKSHRAEVDALNTLRFLFHLLERQETLEGVIQTIKGIKY